MLSVAKTAFVALVLTLNYAIGAMTGLEVMTRVDRNNKAFQTMSSEVLMVIVTNQGKRERNFYHLKKYDNGLTKSLIKFYLPTTVKGTSLLTHSRDGQQNRTQWIYLPALKSLQQITGEQEKESFMGSDFTYSDVSGRQLEQDNYTLLKEDNKHYYIKAIPKNQSDLYSRINLLVDKNIFVPIKAVFFDRNNKKLKTLSNNKIKKIKASHVITESLMNNHGTQGHTLLQISNIEVGIPLSDNDVGIKGIKK